MQATVGDRILVRGRRVGAVARHGEIVEVHGENGAPPYLVRWSGGGEASIFPGPDTVIQPGGKADPATVDVGGGSGSSTGGDID